MIYAVVPAGGRSTRMGRPKLALPLGDRTVIEHVIEALRTGGADHVLVVVGPHALELVPLAESAGAEVCVLPEATADMRATVEHGLRRLEERHCPQPDDAWLLAPADHPALDAGAVRALVAARADEPAQSIFIPVHTGRRGHPALIAWRHVAGLRAFPTGEGIDAYLRSHAGEMLEVPVANDGVLCDLDSPEDYERLRRTWALSERPGA
jgi:CTP:molybdopterin cytidylyltransferase MocA